MEEVWAVDMDREETIAEEMTGKAENNPVIIGNNYHRYPLLLKELSGSSYPLEMIRVSNPLLIIGLGEQLS